MALNFRTCWQTFRAIVSICQCGDLPFGPVFGLPLGPPYHQLGRWWEVGGGCGWCLAASVPLLLFPATSFPRDSALGPSSSHPRSQRSRGIYVHITALANMAVRVAGPINVVMHANIGLTVSLAPSRFGFPLGYCMHQACLWKRLSEVLEHAELETCILGAFYVNGLLQSWRQEAAFPSIGHDVRTGLASIREVKGTDQQSKT